MHSYEQQGYGQQQAAQMPAPSAAIADRLSDVRRLLGQLADTHGRMVKLADRLFGPVPPSIGSGVAGEQISNKVPVEPPQLVGLERTLNLVSAKADEILQTLGRLEAL